MTRQLLCGWCDEPIEDDQNFHRECILRSLVGGVNHLRGKCYCCGGDEPPDPPGLSRREAAREAVVLFETKRQRQCEGTG